MLSPNEGMGIFLRKNRKAPSPAAAITSSITATVTPADPLEGLVMTLAVGTKSK